MVAKLRTVDEQAQSLANYMPGGRLFAKKNIQDSNFRKLLTGLAGELFTADGYLRSYADNIIPDTTILFIDKWERAVGNPDDCFDGQGTLTDRRRDIVVKLASLGIQTPQDFIDVALLFGKVVTVTSLSKEAFPPYAVPFLPVSLPEGRFVIVVTGEDLTTNPPPYAVPFDLTDSESIMECLFKKLKPANCALIFRNTN